MQMSSGHIVPRQNPVFGDSLPAGNPVLCALVFLPSMAMALWSEGAPISKGENSWENTEESTFTQRISTDWLLVYSSTPQ